VDRRDGPVPSPERGHDVGRVQRKLQRDVSRRGMSDDVRPLDPETVEQHPRMRGLIRNRNGSVWPRATAVADAVISDELILIGELGLTYKRGEPIGKYPA
jgi:hypothetical protein